MKLVNVTDFKTKAAEILQLVEQEDVIVTCRGKPKAVLKQLTEDDLEDYILVHHPEFIAQREAARADEAAGRIVDIDTLIREVEDAKV